MRDAENGRYVKASIEWEISVPSTQFYCEPKPAKAGGLFKRNIFWEAQGFLSVKWFEYFRYKDSYLINL